jgi:FKBP-type peptidyl-prolyl cis-trans isomerase
MYRFGLLILLFVLYSCKQENKCTPLGYQLHEEHFPDVEVLVDADASIYFIRTKVTSAPDHRDSFVDYQKHIISKEELENPRLAGSPLIAILPCMKPGMLRIYALDTTANLLLDDQKDHAALYLYVALDSVISESGYKAYLERLKAEEESRLQQYKSFSAQASAILKSYIGRASTAFPQSMENGIRYQLLDEGTGNTKPEPKKDLVELSYILCLPNGQIVDDTYQKGRPLKFLTGTGFVATFMDTMASVLVEGQRAVFFIPASEVYEGKGFKGNIEIPAGANLYAYVKCEAIQVDFKTRLY